MRVLLTGATGVIGRRLAAHLLGRGDEVVVVTRDEDAAGRIPGCERAEFVLGDPTFPGAWQSAVDGVDAIVHLACAGLGEKAFDYSACERLREHRLDSTFQIAMAIEEATKRPETFVMVSNRCAASSEEDQPLPGVIKAWEEQALALGELGVRVAVLRLGYMLDPRGHSLADIANVQTGDHRVGWIHVHDVVGCLETALRTNVSGVLETVAKDALPLSAMKKQVPATTGRSHLKEEARALLEWSLPLESARRLDEAGYAFRFPTFDDALNDLTAPQPKKDVAAPVRHSTSEQPSTEVRRVVVLPYENLLFVDGHLHHNAPDALARLISAGLTPVLATSCGGKLPLGLAEQLGIRTPLIAADGSVLLDPVHREAIRTEALSGDRVTGIAMAVRTSDAQVRIVVERGIQVSAEPKFVLPEALRALTSVDDVLEHGALFARPATRLLLHAPQRRLERALGVIRDTWWREQIVAIYEYAPDVVAITAPSADRGVALQRLESMAGLPRRTSIVIASSARDGGLLEFAGVGFALPSLEARVASHATSVLSSDDPIEIADAVIRAHLARTMRASTSRG